MKKYKLLKDLPTFKAGEEFELDERGDLVKCYEPDDPLRRGLGITAYRAVTINKFPNILKDWFEEIPEQPKTVWDLKVGDICYARLSTRSRLGETPVHPEKIEWDDSVHYQSLRAIGAIFLTAEDCQRSMERDRAEQVLLRDAKGFKPDWSDEKQAKYEVAYITVTDELVVSDQHLWNFGSIFFGTEQDARDSIKIHREEWLTYLGVEE